jgi:hypothetical protein
VSGVSNTAKDIATGFQANLAKIKTFYGNLKALIKANLDPTLLQQITSAGPDAGNATAEAILASGQAGIDGLSETARGIKKVSGDIGAIVATAMAGSNDEMGNGLIDGLMSQQERFNEAAAVLGASAGKEVAKAVKKSAVELLGEGKITFGQFAEMDRGKPLNVAEKKKAVTPFSGMSSLFSTQGIPTNLVSPKLASKQGMFSFDPTSIQNPYNKTKQFYEYSAFEKARNQAVTYNLNVTVPYGASDVEIGRVLIKQIQSFEKTNGATWRGGR